MTDHLVFGVDPVICKEWRVLDGLLISIVVCKFCQWEVTTPIVLLVVDVYPEVLFQYGIGSFGLSVCLWIESRAESSLDP